MQACTSATPPTTKPVRPTMPAIFFGHGSPTNAIEDNVYTKSWSKIGQTIVKPKGIISISAHWDISQTSVTAMEHPRTIHEFGGFPKEMYEITYPAPGDPSLAQRVAEKLLPLTGEVLADKGKWGLDHGTWSVLSRVYPEADIPVIQLSIDSKKPASYHYEVGRLLASFREEGILVMGSGNIVHNLGELNWGQRQSIYPWAERFGQHVRQAILDERPQEVIAYEKMGGQDARLSVPTPEHYLPLLYALGARQITDTVTFETPVVEYGSLDMTTVIFSSSFQ